MKVEDIEQLTAPEREALRNTFFVNAIDGRMRYVAIDVGLVVLALGLLLLFQAPLWTIGSLLVAFLVVLLFEKVSYVRAAKMYRSMVRKLVHRVESLEGVRLTPRGAAPVEIAASTVNDRGEDGTSERAVAPAAGEHGSR